MKKPFQIMCENGNLRVLPYDENNALPSVLAKDEDDALKIVDQLYRLQNRAFNAEDIRNYEEDITDKHLEMALDYHDQAMYMEEHSYGWKINDSQLNNLRLKKVSELWDEDGNRFTLDELECINDGTRGDVALGNYAGPYYYSDPTQD